MEGAVNTVEAIALQRMVYGVHTYDLLYPEWTPPLCERVVRSTSVFWRAEKMASQYKNVVSGKCPANHVRQL